MISNQFDLYYLCFIVIIIKLKQRKIQTKLVWNHSDLKFILTYNMYTEWLLNMVKHWCERGLWNKITNIINFQIMQTLQGITINRSLICLIWLVFTHLLCLANFKLTHSHKSSNQTDNRRWWSWLKTLATRIATMKHVSMKHYLSFLQ